MFCTLKYENCQESITFFGLVEEVPALYSLASPTSISSIVYDRRGVGWAGVVGWGGGVVVEKPFLHGKGLHSGMSWPFFCLLLKGMWFFWEHGK